MCALGPLRFDDPRDGVSLRDSPPLRHVADAVQDGARVTAGALVDAPPPLVRAPRPEAWLRQIHAANPGRAGLPLRVLTWNLALLDATLFGFVPYKKSPHLAARRAVLPDLVAGVDADVVLLQEAWTEGDRLALEAAAGRAGFLTFHGPRRRYTDGLVTLVRAALVRGGPACLASPYADSDPREFFPGPRIRRGFLEVAFSHPDLGPVRILNTHLLAWAKNWRVRVRQARQLGRRAAVAPDDALVIVGGDLNAAPYYPRDTWVHPDGRPEGGWWGNTLSWAVLQHYGGLVDLGVRGAADPLLDITLQDTLRPDPAGKVDVCAWAEATRHPRHFTATDENRLYAAQYRGTEYPARIDQVFARDPGGRVGVVDVRPAFAEILPGLGVEASDHVGVALTLRITPGAPGDMPARGNVSSA